MKNKRVFPKKSSLLKVVLFSFFLQNFFSNAAVGVNRGGEDCTRESSLAPERKVAFKVFKNYLTMLLKRQEMPYVDEVSYPVLGHVVRLRVSDEVPFKQVPAPEGYEWNQNRERSKVLINQDIVITLYKMALRKKKGHAHLPQPPRHKIWIAEFSKDGFYFDSAVWCEIFNGKASQKISMKELQNQRADALFAWLDEDGKELQNQGADALFAWLDEDGVDLPNCLEQDI